MKKLAILFLILALFSCKKKEYCASCKELNSGFVAADYCGTQEEIDAYIADLKNYQVITGQNWQCTVY